MGAAIAIDGLLAPDLARGNLVKAHPIVRPTRRQFVLEYEQRMAEDPALTAFVAWLNEARGQQSVRPLAGAKKRAAPVVGALS
jgi:LysR family glycine cleavage system transcriptional activator